MFRSHVCPAVDTSPRKRFASRLYPLSIILVTVVALTLGCEGSLFEIEFEQQRWPERAPVTSEHKAIIFVIDGPRYTETFGDPLHKHVPHLWNELRPLGTMYENFRNQGWTVTVSGHANILTGTWQQLNSDGSEHPHQPTIFEYYRQTTSAPQHDAVLVGGKPKLAACGYSTHPSYGAVYGAYTDVTSSNDLDTYDRLISFLQTDRPHLVMASFSQVDTKGHSGDWEAYVNQIEIVDSLAWSTWNYLESDSFYAGETFLFIIADHGRHDDQNGGFQGHGCSCDGCQHLVFLALGPGVREDYVLPRQYLYTQRDLCATVGHILDVPTPFSDGHVMLEMFEPVTTGIVGSRERR